jgi:hypothetical protein
MLRRGSEFAGGGILVKFQMLSTLCILFMFDIKGDAGVADGAACDPSNALQLQNLIGVVTESFVLKDALGHGGYERLLVVHQNIFSGNIESRKTKGNCTLHDEAEEERRHAPMHTSASTISHTDRMATKNRARGGKRD